MVKELLNVGIYKNIEVGMRAFALVFGKGVVKRILPDSDFVIEIEFENGHCVFYNLEGEPNWSNISFRTLYFDYDFDVFKVDTIPSEEVLKAEEIITLRENGKLLMSCPSGVFVEVEKCPNELVETNLEQKKFRLFKKAD